MYCKHCYKMMDDGLDICPYCGKSQTARVKKPIHKKWWFWALIVFLAIGVIGGGADDESDPQGTDNSVSQAEIESILNSIGSEQEEPSLNTIIDNSTLGEKNALRSAKSYLSFSAFSYTGLIRQLEYEGYTTEEATYAVNNCGADWDEQALKTAKSYLSHSAFSYTGLISQLEFEGFSTTEATYAVNNCGADWKEQALKSARSYLSHSAFSQTGLIGQLEFEGFTLIEATYGVENCGADWFEQAAKCAESYLRYSSFSRQGLIDQLIYEGFTQQQAEHGVHSVGY